MAYAFPEFGVIFHTKSVRIRVLNRMVSAIFDEAVHPHGIKASQLNILVAVSAYGPVTSRQLCKALHMDPSTASRTINRIKENSWLQSEPSGDGKVLTISITPAGRKLIQQVFPDWKKGQAKTFESLGQTAAKALLAAGNQHLQTGMSK